MRISGKSDDTINWSSERAKKSLAASKGFASYAEMQEFEARMAVGLGSKLERRPDINIGSDNFMAQLIGGDDVQHSGPGAGDMSSQSVQTLQLPRLGTAPGGSRSGGGAGAFGSTGMPGSGIKPGVYSPPGSSYGGPKGLAGVSLEQQEQLDGGRSQLSSAWNSQDMFAYDRRRDSSRGLGSRPRGGFGSKLVSRNKETNDPKKDIFNNRIVRIMNEFGTLSKVKFSMMRKNVRNNLVYSCEKKISDECAEQAIYALGFKFFEKLSTDQVKLCVQNMYMAKFRPGEYVFRKGTKGHHFYSIFSGEVDIIIQEGARPIAVLGPGQSFGELALINDAPRM